jgi:hypothetical protein
VFIVILLGWSVSSVFVSRDSPQEKTARGEATSPSATEKLESRADDSGGVAEGDGTPRISFSEDTHDFGNVARGAKLTHNFKVRNTGDAPLKIIDAKGG